VAKKPLALYWSSSKPNFGDALSPLICEAVSSRKIRYAKTPDCDLISIGSLMQRVKEGFFKKQIHVWGTGFIEEKSPYKSKHIYHAIRGQLSNQTISNHQITTLGDPGLLADLLLKPNQHKTKKYKIGFIEHYKDKNNPLISQLVDKYANTTRIDIYLPPLIFLARLAECDVIFSSAMHGLIAADSLGIPNSRIVLSDQLRGGDFKFQDYYSAFNIASRTTTLDIDTIQTSSESIANNYSRPYIDEIKKKLYAAFPQELD